MATSSAELRKHRINEETGMAELFNPKVVSFSYLRDVP